MTPQDRAKMQASIMLAFAGGAEVECVEIGRKGWSHTHIPAWDWSIFDYRVKVVPKVVKYLCWSNDYSLIWIKEESPVKGDWTRVPSEDKEVAYD